MGAFALIEGKQYEAFCALYEESAHLRAEGTEFADLMPGNYAVALLGAGRYEAAADFCRRQIQRDRSGARDRSSAASFIALSIAHLALGQHGAAMAALTEGSRATYQDSARTEVPLLLYCEAVLLGDRQALREAKKLLSVRLRRGGTSPEFAAARFLTGKCGEGELLAEIGSLVPVLRERRQVTALLCMAVKERESGNMAAYRDRLQAAVGLYARCPAVVMELSFHLAERCLTREL